MAKRIGNVQTPDYSGVSDIINLRQHKNYVEQDIFPTPDNDVLSGLLFDGSSYLSKDFSVSNRRTFTFSAFVKFSKLDVGHTLFGLSLGSGGGWRQFSMFLNSDNKLRLFSDTGQVNNSGSLFEMDLKSTALYRDLSSWYHLVFAVDSTQITESNRASIYVNGVKITSFDTATYPGKDNQSEINNTLATHGIGRSIGNGANSFYGYLANIHFIDGQALDPSYFGYSDRETGQWKPKKYSGTYGGNGFYLPLNTDIYRYFNAAASVNLSGSPITTFPCTVSCWVNLNDVGGTYGQVINLNVSGTRASIFYNYDDNTGFTGDQANTFIICIGSQNHFATENLRTYPNSGWHHIAAVFKSGTNVTPDVYIDGEFVSTTNRGGGHGGTGVNAIGSNGSSGEYFSGYITNVAFFNNYTITQEEITEIYNSGLDGDLTTLSITQPSSYLKLNEKSGTTVAATLGSITGTATNTMITNSLDFSGNHNDWTPVGFSGQDSVIDSPQNTFATLNPLENLWFTFSNGNLTTVRNGTSSGSWRACGSTLSVESGVWYYEVLISNGEIMTGVFSEDVNILASNQPQDSQNSAGMVLYEGQASTASRIRTDSSFPSNISEWAAANTIIGFLLDFTNTTVKVYFNGTLKHNSSFSSSAIIGKKNKIVVVSYSGSNNGNFYLNFGQDPTFGGNKSPSGTYTDANGIGSFYYEPPEGALALCTRNLPNPDIAKPEEYFNPVIYAGDLNNNTHIECGFQPDLVWIKNRGGGADGSSNNMLFNSLSGPLNYLSSDKTDQELSNVNGLQEFTNTGFRPGSMTRTNETNYNYVAWCWKAGGAPSGNDKGVVDGVERTITGDSKLDAGTITPTKMSVNTKAGFSIISYTGDNQDSTIPHGLNSPPEMIIVKQTSGSGGQWYTWHKGLTGTDNLRLNENVSTFGTGTAGNIGKNVNQNTFGFNQGSSDFSGPNGVQNYIVYCWHSVPGYSMLGTYTGNGSTNGPFVYLGFRPSFLLIKTTGTEQWAIIDTSRYQYNDNTAHILFANRFVVEDLNANYHQIDILSNGFKIRGQNQGLVNGTNYGYIYAAFAEQPIGFTNSR